MRTIKIILSFLFFNSFLLHHASAIPARPNPPRLVNDFVNFLKPNEVEALERKLVSFDDSTSTQIAIAIVNDLEGYDKASYAYMIAQQWGVGQKGKNNGALILIKPKTADSKGEVFITTGYGLEGVLPDAVCKRIVDNEIIPRFKSEDYYGGIDAATTIMMSLAKKDFSNDNYMHKTAKKEIKGKSIFWVIVILFFILFSIFGKRNSNKQHTVTSGSTLPWWLLMGGLGSSGSSKGNDWGSFSSGGGSFGGFGGGSFGGGGAGGSW